ncbi:MULTISPECIES: RtcB family protein [Dermacoccus]|uniref:3'-phosphate/5'-hydroxy nucleic acid ligase n=2 Tax=Dermacoccus TaxID=57495 RepID=A0A417Z3S1_9MICO|nr:MULTISPECIES: RtcB family protein [Dermacoccus]KLO63827.1 transferase [Dermacoccus sp. PE3]MBE7370706.1 RtcB family protein [Dermacoccus barathri]QEH92205.1 RtcB family protein [Dermacoccus abyssi]RHW45216.1 RtcB family protein [Dermacoccus abyssi]
MERISPTLFNWASILEDSTREQAVTTASMPFVFPHLALMPDAHLGRGATVGSVIPTLGAIIPAAVGVDIGCGMIAVRTQHTAADLPTERASVRQAIERAIPLSAGGANRKISREHTQVRIDELETMAEEAGFDPAAYAKKWKLQLGSLGSGNHFIEISLDEEDRVWLFLHSGSRGVGNRIAQHHIKAAEAYCRTNWIQLPDRDLAYLVEGTPQFDAYIRELRWAQHFALLNREEMMDRVVRQYAEWVGEPVTELERINCHHNYTEQEKHFGKNVWLSRKGAINAEAGRPGLIPGSMGTASYVVVGKGNALSLNSSPHGAGRAFSRSAARKRFTGDELREAMKGIEYRDTDAFIDEIPGAYKDIDQVMADAADLVEIRHTLRQIVNVKGD